MNLPDHEILELNALCGAVVDGTLTETQRDRLASLLRESEAARRAYVRAMGQSASLHSYASEMQTEAPDAPVRLQKVFRFSLWWAAVLPAAAALVFGVFFAGRSQPIGMVDVPPRVADFVAQVTGAKVTQWAQSSAAVTSALRGS